MGGQLHLVKHLYVDDDGHLVARAWDGKGSVGVPFSSVGKPGGVAMLDGNGQIPVEEMTPFLPEIDHLPPPGPDYAGHPVRVRPSPEETPFGPPPGPSGKKTEIFVCVLSSQDEYQWVKLSEST